MSNVRCLYFTRSFQQYYKQNGKLLINSYPIIWVVVIGYHARLSVRIALHINC